MNNLEISETCTVKTPKSIHRVAPLTVFPRPGKKTSIETIKAIRRIILVVQQSW